MFRIGDRYRYLDNSLIIKCLLQFWNLTFNRLFKSLKTLIVHANNNNNSKKNSKCHNNKINLIHNNKKSKDN